MTRVAWWWSAATARACAFGWPRWLRVTTAVLLASVPVALIAALWLCCAVLVVFWPLAWPEFLMDQLGVIYPLCWFGWVPFAWIVALVLPVRDPQRAAVQT